jgi:hypothetical protein
MPGATPLALELAQLAPIAKLKVIKHYFFSKMLRMIESVKMIARTMVAL